MKIRRARPSDAEAIAALIHRCSEVFILPEFESEGRATYLRSHNMSAIEGLLSSCAYWVTEDESKIVGVIGIQNRNHLYHLHVDPDYHRQGLATRLWRTAQSGIPARITVNASRYAIPFYEKLGFLMVGERSLNGVVYFAMAYDRTLQFDF